MPRKYSARQVLKALSRLGFTKISQRGSHIKLRGVMAGRLQTVIVPNHKIIATGTLSSILRQANMTKQDLEDNI